LYPSSQIGNFVKLGQVIFIVLISVLVIIQALVFLVDESYHGFIATAMLWIDQNFSYSLPVLGIVMYLVLSITLVNAVASGVTLVTRIIPPPITIYPLRAQSSFLSTLLTCVGVYLLSSFGVNYFMIEIMTPYTSHTQLYYIQGVIAKNSIIVSWYLRSAYIYVFIIFVGIGLVISLLLNLCIQTGYTSKVENSRMSYVFDDE
jgi:hypothetical protein